MEPLEDYKPEIDVHVDHYNYMGQHLKEISSHLAGISRILIGIGILLAFIAYKLS